MVLRRAASTSGTLPTRTWERSSAKVTSRTQWERFSICQWARLKPSRAAAGRAGAGYG